MTKGIDVSENNGRVDWQAVADAGQKFAIVRSSYGRYAKDEDFLRNVDGAHTAGLQCGAYHYSYALTPEQARQEARSCKQVIDEAGVLLELPVWFDMEDADSYKRKHCFDFSADNVTAICRAFLDEIKPLDCGVYASLHWFENYIDWQGLGCAVWNAQWSDRDDIKGYMWQYTDNLVIGGKAFDGNILYHDI
jgi:GH25 family lysozyme M1 (1,4-beta-N-acetylmuramidase)